MENKFEALCLNLDLLEEPREVHNLKSLEEVFKRQRSLMDKLIIKNSMVPYPLDINLKDNQSYIRNIMAYAIQELSESFEVYKMSLEELNKAKKDSYKIYQCIVQFNEELSDYFHFLVELFILCGLDEHGIDTYYQKLMEDANVKTLYMPNDLMKTALGYARYVNSVSGRILLVHKYYDIKPLVSGYMNPSSEWILVAGRRVSHELLAIYESLMWNITHYGYLALNKLKKKPWRDNGPTTDLQIFLEALMECWLYSFCLFDFAGHEPYSLYTTYKIKNKININRIDNKY